MNALSEKCALAQTYIDPAIAGRDYQINAVRAVLEGMAQKQRHFLLVMATGTGKTRTSIALVDALLRAGLAEKVLFLVDRIALREQALAAFKEHLPNEPRWPQVGEKCIATDRRVYVATYPTMHNILQDAAHPLSPDFFDVIVVDESHRSIYNTYGAVLDYFNAITVGLTATPTESIDHNTFALFHCEGGIPTFSYSYEEATNNTPPYLCDFQAKKIHAIPSFAIRGNKRPLSLAAQRQRLQQGQDLEEIDYNGTPVGAYIASEGINTRIIQEFMEKSIKDSNGVLPGKTIFFCASKAHARCLQNRLNTLYPQYHGALAKVLVSDDPQVYGKGGLLDQFSNNDMPRIAISVDMLDTGIDVREIVNLVFAKPVYSSTKFWQMMGRGTRLLDKPTPWCCEKAGFLVLDCWDNFAYFKIDPIQEPILLDRLYKKEGVASDPQHAAVCAALASFLHTHTTLSNRQKTFLALLQDFLVMHEKVEKRDLINAPFTVIHPQGIRGVFSPDEINEILPLTERLAA